MGRKLSEPCRRRIVQQDRTESLILGKAMERDQLGAQDCTALKGTVMLQPTNQKVTAVCPSGHKVRGNANLVGKTVKCPRCDVGFVFALTFKPSAAVEAKEVTDTGVMRILGSMDAVPPAPKRRAKTERPCPRCGTAVAENTPVCAHCNCYLGVLPTFLHEMSPDTPNADSARS